MSIIEKIKDSKAIQRLFNIETREVSLVDHPAIDEPFIEVKSAKGRENDGQSTAKEEEAMIEEKKVAEMIQAALTPIAETLSGIKAKLEGSEKSVTDAVKSQVASLETLSAGLKEMDGKVTAIIDEAGKRFDEIEKFVTTPRSQRINGDGAADGQKKQVLWPSLSH